MCPFLETIAFHDISAAYTYFSRDGACPHPAQGATLWASGWGLPHPY